MNASHIFFSATNYMTALLMPLHEFHPTLAVTTCMTPQSCCHHMNSTPLLHATCMTASLPPHACQSVRYTTLAATTCMPATPFLLLPHACQPQHSCCHHMHAGNNVWLASHAFQQGSHTTLAAITCMPARQPYHSCCHHMHANQVATLLLLPSHACQPHHFCCHQLHGSYSTLDATT